MAISGKQDEIAAIADAREFFEEAENETGLQ